jgi:ankyrin repeat protein
VVTREKLERWLEEGADLNQELSNAVIASDVDRIKFLIEKGAEINKPDSQGWTPLANAARQRKDKIIKVLLDAGADPNIASNGMTPLIAAAMRDHVASVKVLAEKGADVEEPGPQGFRPLALAIAEQRYEVAKALMEAGADVSIASGADGLTPLMLIAAQMAAADGAMFVPGSTRPIDVAKGLIDRGANVNAQAKNGTTALMVAATHNNPPMIGLLMEAGADANLKNDRGQTARDVAQLNGNAEAAQAILVLGSAKAASAPKPEGEDKTPTPQ